MRDNLFKNFILILLSFVLIITMTFPLIAGINKYIPGFFSTDESYAVLSEAWRIKYSLMKNLSIKKTDFIAHPFGIDFYGNKPIGYLWFVINYTLSILTTPILTYNLQVIFNFFLTVLFTYLLVFSLTRNLLVGVFSGVIFGFCPYIFVRSWQHLGETYLWVTPFVLLWLFILRKKTTKTVKVFFILGLISSTLGFNFYYIGVALAVFFVYLFLYSLKNKLLFKNEERIYIRNIFLLCIIAFIILLPQTYPVIKGILSSGQSVPSAQNPYYRPFEDLFIQSARPLSYILPPIVHPIFGKFTERFVGSSLYGVSFTEHTLYLGWTPLLLAFLAFRKYRLKRKQSTVHSPQSTEECFYIGFFVILAIVAWLFSQPPWWKFGPIKVYMPSFFMYKILPMFRAYCRFGIVVMLAVAVLAGFGLKFILEKFRSQKTKIALACLFSGLVIFEFWNWPPYKVIDVSKVPGVYYWLKEQTGDFAIAEYPLDADSPNEMYKFYQTKHEKKIINGTIPGTYANRVAQTIIKLSDPHTAGVLEWMGVRYVLVHREDYLKTDLIEEIEELNNIPHNSSLRFIGSFSAQDCPQRDIMCVQRTGPIDVYEIVASPIEPGVNKFDK